MISYRWYRCNNFRVIYYDNRSGTNEPSVRKTHLNAAGRVIRIIAYSKIHTQPPLITK